jgi:hypothetical protein
VRGYRETAGKLLGNSESTLVEYVRDLEKFARWVRGEPGNQPTNGHS